MVKWIWRDLSRAGQCPVYSLLEMLYPLAKDHFIGFNAFLRNLGVQFCESHTGTQTQYSLYLETDLAEIF